MNGNYIDKLKLSDIKNLIILLLVLWSIYLIFFIFYAYYLFKISNFITNFSDTDVHVITNKLINGTWRVMADAMGNIKK